MHADSFTQALARLDPASRALLDLSLRRGMRPDEISDLLGIDAESVVVAREQALEQLAGELGMDDVDELDDVRAGLAELPPEAWTPPPPDESSESGRRRRRALTLVRPESDRGENEDENGGGSRQEQPPAGGRKSRLPLLLALLSMAAIALVVVMVSRAGDDGSSSTQAGAPAPAPAGQQPQATPAPQPQPAKRKSAQPKAATPKPSKSKPKKPKKRPTPKPAPSSAARAARLATIGAGAAGAAGTAALTQGGRRLVLDVSGLPSTGSGRYEVWLYDTVIDARSLGSARGRDLKLDLRLPPAASRYRYVDVSVEPADGNPNHSGQSVLRAPLSKLAR